MKFSIIIPAFNEEEWIAKPIKALLAQDYPREQFEIIVVDNNSTDLTSQKAKEAGADKVVLEIQKGTNPARQRGVKESEGEVLVFLDADCQPNTGWLKKIEQSLSKPGVVAVSGPYDYGFTGLKRFIGLGYSHIVLVNIAKVLYLVFRKKAGVLIGGNFAVLKTALDKIGGLPPIVFYGDDSTTAMLISRLAGRVAFLPRLVVKSSPRRLQKEGALWITFQYVRHYLKAYFSVPKHPPVPYDLSVQKNHK